MSNKIHYNDLMRIRQIEVRANALGFQLTGSQHSYNSGVTPFALKPLDAEALPCYAQDAELFRGNLDEIMSFLLGAEWSREYDMLLRLSTPARRERKEKDTRQRNLVELLKRQKEAEQEMEDDIPF